MPAASPVVAPPGVPVDYAFTAEWEFACCGTPHRIGDLVPVTPLTEETAWNACLDRPIRWYVGHHDAGDPAPLRGRARILRIWEAWSGLSELPGGGYEATRDDARLIECGSTSPHAGSEDARIVPIPRGVRSGQEHWGWVLQVLPEPPVGD